MPVIMEFLIKVWIWPDLEARTETATSPDFSLGGALVFGPHLTRRACGRSSNYAMSARAER